MKQIGKALKKCKYYLSKAMCWRCLRSLSCKINLGTDSLSLLICLKYFYLCAVAFLLQKAGQLVSILHPWNVRESPLSRGTQRENFSKILENIIFSFLRLFQSILKAYLCKLIQIDLFGFFRWKFRPQKILGNRILRRISELLMALRNASWPYFAF